MEGIMLKDEPWIRPAEGLSCEVLQAADEGKDIADLLEREKALSAQSPYDDAVNEKAKALYHEIDKRPCRSDYPYREPYDYADILSLCRHEDIRLPPLALPKEALLDRIEGAWLARCSGCLLGKPIEGWRRERIHGLLKDTDNFPVKKYISSVIDPSIREKYQVHDGPRHGAPCNSWINNVTCMPEDDDTNYTVLSLNLLEKYGLDFSPEDVAERWLSCLPYLHLCTAERVAYKNLASYMMPPASAKYCNPYREFLGPQIRCDAYGYVCPGNPVKAAELAYKDACISGVKNGVYGAMFFAAVLAAAAVEDDPDKLIQTGLCCIPQTSRLHEAVVQLMHFSRSAPDKDAVLQWITSRYDEANFYHWCHAIPNTLIICTALLYSRDLDSLLSTCVEPGFDTDCNAATAGSIWGMRKGKKALPAHWLLPASMRWCRL